MRWSLLSVFFLCLLAASIPVCGQTTFYIDDDAVADPGPGDPSVSDPLEDGSEAHPFDAIQEGIDASINGDTVLILDGTYTGIGNRDLDFGGKAITVCSENGASTTTIDCEFLGRGFYFHAAETADSIIDGLTIQHGSATDGGGIYCGGLSAASPTITNCILWSCSASRYGGGFFCNAESAPDITHCIISTNWALEGGGGICCEDLVTNADLTNCLIVHNEVDSGRGGGIYCMTGAKVMIFNCTVTENTATQGGGLACWNNTSNATLRNTIFWENTAPAGHEISMTDSTIGVSLNCDIDGGTAEVETDGSSFFWSMGGDIDTDPLFVLPTGNEYFLSQIAAGQASNSPCVDAGADTAIEVELEINTTRSDLIPDSGMVDMGYHSLSNYEFGITDIYWNQNETTVVIAFKSLLDVEYSIDTAEADAYNDSLLWTSLTTVVATTSTTTASDNLTTTPLTYDYRFYRIRRVDKPALSRHTVGVFELDLTATPALKFISTPLVPDTDYDEIREIFGEGATRQIPRSGLQIGDFNESTGIISRVRYDVAGTCIGTPFDIVPCTGYELFMGFGPPLTYTLRLTGYVPEEALVMDLRKIGTQSIRWTAYSMPRPIQLSAIGLQTGVSPWSPLNKVALLFPGSSVWSYYTFNGSVWSPDDPIIQCGMGIRLVRFGPPDMLDSLLLEPWYDMPPNQ